MDPHPLANLFKGPNYDEPIASELSALDYLYEVLLENHESENYDEVLEEEIYKVVHDSSLIEKHDCNDVTINSINVNYANDMQSHKLGDAMFDEDDIFSPPSFDEQIYYDDSMPPIYDDYIYECGFGEVMTLFNDDSTILEEVSIDYDNKVAICDDYGDDMYDIKSDDNHETCHHYFNVQFDYANQVSHHSYFC